MYGAARGARAAAIVSVRVDVCDPGHKLATRSLVKTLSCERMGKKAKHVSEPNYFIPAAKGTFGLPKLGGVSKKKALSLAKKGKTGKGPRLDPKQTARLKKAGKAKGKKGGKSRK